jgi:hypothetical protein
MEPIPTPFQDKKPVPPGYTGGIKNRVVTKAKMEGWIRRGFLIERGQPILNNLGILLPDGWLGLDVDAYGGKAGRETKARLEKKYGEWPKTAISTNRDDGVSGVYLFKGFPLNTAWKTGSKAGEGLDGFDLVRSDYRHVQAYPSVHHSGRVYRWLNTKGVVPNFGSEIADISHMQDFIDFLKKGDGTRGVANLALPAGLDELEAWTANLQEGEQCYATYEALKRYTDDLSLGSSHPVLVSVTRALVGLGQAGHLGVPQALDAFETAFEESLAHREGESDPFEFQKALLWALGKEKANREQATKPCKCTFTGGELFELDEKGELVEQPAQPREVSRKSQASPGLTYTKASDIVMKPIHWLWEGYIPLGELTLLAGAEGEGKSSISIDFAADLSNGHMRGHFKGVPRSVAIATTEDAWDRTVAPRLRAAGADMDMVYQVQAADYGGGVMLPRDINAFEADVGLMGFGMLILDPLNSTLDAALDTHKDAEVRRALEPLVSMAERTGCSVIGLIHLNKAKTTNPMTALMGSRAYGAVARAVLFVDRVPDESDVRILGLPKNNLGVTNPASLLFAIEGRKVGEFEGEDITAAKIVWKGESPLSIRDVMESSKPRASDVKMTKAEEAQEWLSNFLQERAECVPSTEVKEAAEKVGISAQRLKGAAKTLNIKINSSGFPRKTCWEDAGQSLFGDVEGYDDDSQEEDKGKADGGNSRGG